MPKGPQPQLSCRSPRCSRPWLESAFHRRAGQGHLSCRHPVARSAGSQSSHQHGWHCSWPWWPGPFLSPLSHQLAAHWYPGRARRLWTMHPCVPGEALAGQGDRSTPQTQAGTPTGRVWEESCAREASAKARWEYGSGNCVGIWVAGMCIQGMHELTAPGDSRWCSSAYLHNHH